MQNYLKKSTAILLAVMMAVVFMPATAFAASSADTITYKTDQGESVDFDGDKFNDVCEDFTDYDLDYVKFSLPSSSKGILYFDYDEDDEDGDEVSGSDKCDVDDIDDITFVPDEDYYGSFTITYTGYYTDDDDDSDSFKGSVKITVEEDEDSSGDIEYEVDSDDSITFKKKDFNEYCFVVFDLPSSTKGKLYYDYDGDDEEKLGDGDECYYSDDDYGDFPISGITFVPNKSYDGDVAIDFEGEDEDGNSISGTVLITVNGDEDDLDSADDIKYSATAGSNINFDDDDFNDACDDMTGEELDYVKFTLPASSKGTLYYGYTTGGSNTTKVSASTKYYYDSKPYIRSVTFVPSGSSSGTVTIEYKAYDIDGEAFTGEIVLTYQAKSTANTSSLYFSDVNGGYSWAVLYVDTLYSTGVLTGSGTGTTAYNPGVNITRGDYLLYLYKALNLPYNTSAGSFSDVPAGSTYYDAIASAKALGIAKGFNNVFGVNSQITREDAMVLALRAMSVSGMGYVQGDVNSLSTFTDNSKISDYAKEAIATLVKSGVITGSNNQISPKNNISRAEAAAMIYRIKF